LQQINNQFGVSWSFGGTPWNAQSWELSSGTSSIPNDYNGPLVKISKLLQPKARRCLGSPRNSTPARA
jgi:hypothetical protein